MRVLLLALAALAISASATSPSASPFNPSSRGRELGRGSRTAVDRDPYIFNLFEVLLTTLETKLRRVENMDRALEMLVRRLDGVEARLALSLNATSQLATMIETRLDAMDSAQKRNSDSGANNLMDQRLRLLTQHVERIDSKLSSLQQQLDTNTIDLPPDELVAAASEQFGVGLDVPRLQALEKAPELGKLNQAMNAVKESVAAVDRRLQFHMAMVSENMDRLTTSVNDIHASIIEDERPEPPTTDSPVNTTTSATPHMPPRTKLDSLVDRMSPIEGVWTKMEEVWDVVVGTKSSVDTLVPKSEALLSTTQRQERAITTIHTDLTEKTNRIIQNIGQVEERLRKLPSDGPATARDEVNPVKLLHRATMPQHSRDVTPGELDPPFDLVDQRFLAENTTTGGSSSSSTTKRPPVVTTRPPAGPSGVVFPSVQKKPVIVNTTFMLDSIDHFDAKGFSCADLQERGMTKSGIYYVKIRGTTYWFLKVYCDMETAGGGWTVIQRRDDFAEPRESFNRDWENYKHGFGTPDREFWLGNENIFMLTNTDNYMLRVELEDFDGNTRYAEYSTFKLHSEQDMYKLEIGGYSGTAGDSLNDPWYGSNLSPFSTYNRDNDRSSLNCASMLKGGWWWRSCGRGLNGLYLTDPNDLIARQGIVWFRWKGWDYTLKRSVLMIKPKIYAKKEEDKSSN
ncbi:uncharacterized protein LOC143036884 [Oratosquilla oratoria]|uniref:uncharacterized protein LOC143036884 n=1 Tax=Oratosquilla oratoria TaxID=337810 RepID=UPI003F76901B